MELAGKERNYSLLFWEQPSARRILIKFIKQITQLLREAGVHLPVLQIDLCRDASWTVVKAKLQSSADGLPSSEKKFGGGPTVFSPPGFCFLPLWLKKHCSVFFQPLLLQPTHTPFLHYCVCKQWLSLSDLFKRQVPADLILCLGCKPQPENN